MKKEDLYIMLDMTEDSVKKITELMLNENYTNDTDIAKMIEISYNMNKIKRHYYKITKKEQNNWTKWGLKF